ncbi:hypothetical protein R9X47_10545 [Wukongibacter baidiensis]|uniref:hypothetical protein n=1 Tax=Wukongibacter baidiensis TaxID=1723361 RepID=UPI003D7FB321
MVNHLVLSENAYFYKRKEELTEEFIGRVFSYVSSEKELNEIRCQVIKCINEELDIIYSLLIFDFESQPNFLSEDYTDAKEVKFAYLLIVEYKDYIIVSKRNISGLKEFYKKIENIDYKLLSRLFIDEKTFFNKFSLKNMDIADSALRNKVLESNDLRSSISTFSASRYILNNLRVSNEKEKMSLSLNTSRINKIGNKINITELFSWVISTVDKIESYEEKNTYLDIFSEPIDFESVKESITPICVLFTMEELLNDLELDLIEKFMYKHNNREKNLSYSVVEGIITKLSTFFEVEKIAKNRYKIPNTIDKTLTLKVNKKSITISSSKLKRVVIKYDDEMEINMLEYMNRKSNFIISFDKPDYIYSNRKIFRDNRLMGNLELFESTFIGHEEMSQCTSEKGSFEPDAACFTEDSVFNFVETILCNNSQVLICDDLSNEWADFISVENDSVSFYHAKSKGADGLSATAFQDVVGQALKNLSFFTPSIEQWESKKELWSKKYRNDNVQTQINRLRKGVTVEESIENYIKKVSEPNVRKRVNIVINFISKERLFLNLYKLRNTGECTKKTQIIQILWFISSLINGCNELGIDVHIHCRK